MKNSIIVDERESKLIREEKVKAFAQLVKIGKKIESPVMGTSVFTPDNHISVRGVHERGKYGESFFKMPFVKGHVIYVRESITHESLGGAIYKSGGRVTLGRELADNEYIHIDDIDKSDRGYIPACQMKKKLARTFLTISDVGIGKVRDIDKKYWVHLLEYSLDGPKTSSGLVWRNYKDSYSWFETAEESYASFIEAKFGVSAWKDNVYIWVVLFDLNKN